jgi:hypothetical protein
MVRSLYLPLQTYNKYHQYNPRNLHRSPDITTNTKNSKLRRLFTLKTAKRMEKTPIHLPPHL